MAAYSFADVAVTLIGPGVAISLGSDSGAAEEGITVEMAEDKNTMTKGADDSTMHSLHASNGGSVAVRLLKTSPVNAQLAAAYNFQRSGAANWGQNTIVVSNLQTGDVISCQECAFAKFPNLTYAKEGGMNEWAFHVGKVDGLLGTGSPVAP